MGSVARGMRDGQGSRNEELEEKQERSKFGICVLETLLI